MLVFASVFTFLALAAAAAVIRLRARRKSEATSGILFLLPSLLHLCVFLLAPLAFSLWLAFHRWDLLSVERDFVGLAHFRSILGGEHFWIALRNTALFTLNVPVTMAVSLGIAVVLRGWRRGRNTLLALFFLPNICLFTAVAVVWRWLYSSEYGLVNRLISRLPGVGEARIPWLEDIPLAAGVLPLPLLAIMFMWIWLNIGVQLVIFSAGLEGIPGMYYEAARIDGAGRGRMFLSVTFPLLKPATTFVLITSLIASFQVFTAVYVMVDRTVLRTRAADVLVYQIYDYAWGPAGRMGLASALAWVLFVIILVVSVAQFRLLGREVEYT